MTTIVSTRASEPRRFRLSEAATGWLLLMPALALLLALTLYPVLYGAWLSLFAKHSFFPEQNWVGFGNYLYILQDGEFWASVWRGTVYAVTTIVLQIVLGVAAALVLNEMFPGRNLLRAIVIFPYVVPTVVAVILWKWLLNSQFGLINYMLEDAGLIDRPISWMGRDWIMVSLILVSVWQFFPFVVIGVLARLQSIPNELYEAATVDGANAWQRFRFVTLPQLKSVLFVIVLLRSIWMFTKFDTPWLMIQGGGAETYIRTLPVYTYMRTFAFYEAGKGAAMAMLMFLMLAAASAIYFARLEAGGEPVTRAALLSPRNWPLYLAALALLVFTTFPFLWMGSTAFKVSHEIFATPPTLWPRTFTLANLERLFAETRFLTYFLNSLKVSAATVALTLAVATPAAYSLTRYRFAGRESVAATVLFAYMFAPIMIIIPFYVMMRFVGLNNTHFGLVLAYSAFCLPFALWMLRSLLPEHPARHRGRRDDRRREPPPGRATGRAAARVAGRGRDRHLHLHPGVERLHLRARAAQRGRAEDAAGRDRRPLQRLGGRLGHDHGRRPAGHRAGARRVRVHPEIHGRRARLRRREGIARWRMKRASWKASRR